MRFPSKEIVEQVRRQYPVGTRVELVEMDDFQATISQLVFPNDDPSSIQELLKAWMIRYHSLWLGITAPV